MKKIKWQNRK